MLVHATVNLAFFENVELVHDPVEGDTLFDGDTRPMLKLTQLDEYGEFKNIFDE
jgi:hypothetical protein